MADASWGIEKDNSKNNDTDAWNGKDK